MAAENMIKPFLKDACAGLVLLHSMSALTLYALDRVWHFAGLSVPDQVNKGGVVEEALGDVLDPGGHGGAEQQSLTLLGHPFQNHLHIL